MHDPESKRLALHLLTTGFTVDSVARRTGIPRSTLWRWKQNPERAAALVPRLCPRCHDRALDPTAYAYLLGLYLGDGSIANAPGNKGVFRLEIACDDGWPGLIDAAATTILAVMPGSKVGRRQCPGCTSVNCYSKHWPCLFPQHGPGMKHTRKIELVSWQQEIVDEFTKEFVRGLIHSDGCRGINKVRREVAGEDRWYEYPRYFFTNTSVDIRRLYTDALDRLGIEWKQANARNISVAKREAVARLDEFVGPKY
ncbi:helix-turn-helix domain-containing protein [Actinomadura hibisca]|uniref:helix-turn-helix domain-containing protein n=1 Tax=Actinomadura hibisca TaxID=68565 RepID=UPI0008361AF7|nr:helix-turn-helix domain-containing protein [Actinomadura hibisca]